MSILGNKENKNLEYENFSLYGQKFLVCNPNWKSKYFLCLISHFPTNQLARLLNKKQILKFMMFWCPYCLLLTYFTPCCIVSINDFEQVILLGVIAMHLTAYRSIITFVTRNIPDWPFLNL